MSKWVMSGFGLTALLLAGIGMPARAGGAAIGICEAAPVVEAPFHVSIDTPTAKKSERAVAKIHIKPGTGFHFNQEFPTVVTVTAPAGVTVEHGKQTAKDAVKMGETGADFEVAFVAAEAGSKVFAGELKFAVCSTNTCDPKRESIHFTVDVR